MIAGIICYAIIGLVIGVIFSLLFITFDSSWKKIVTSMMGLGGTTGIISYMNDFYEIKKQEMKFWTTTFLYIMFLTSFFIMMLIMCKLIKDKDDKDILRIRDILLGQKSYINKYYEKREKEIDSRLGIPMLEKREENVRQKEIALENKEKNLKEEKEEIDKLGENKLSINIPYNNKIILTKELLESMPEYIYGLGKFIVDLQVNTETKCNTIQSKNDFITFLYLISTFIIKDIFETSSDSIRIHFRYFNEITNCYEALTVINGKEVITKKLTPIPYNNSLIQKSYECKRALIKSVNADFDYQANNYTVWQDYMAYAFYNFTKNEIPVLTFGISVKNKTIHKNIFYFLSYFNLEQYLEDAFVKVNEVFNLKKLTENGGE